jgi:hypothetical protein
MISFMPLVSRLSLKAINYYSIHTIRIGGLYMILSKLYIHARLFDPVEDNISFIFLTTLQYLYSYIYMFK